MSFLPEGEDLATVSVVGHIFNRIYSLLPHESRLSMVEVEEAQLFLSSRKALISMAPSHLHEDILKYAVSVLDKINELDNYLILKQRNTDSLCSILIVLRVVSDLCKVHWDSKEPLTGRKSSVDSSQSLQSIGSTLNLGIGSESIEYHTVQPDRFDSTIAKRAILLVSRLKSTTALTQELALINGKFLSQSSMYEDLSTRSLFEEIDANCAAILRFLAASNPAEFFDFTVSKLTVLKHNISNDGDFAPYLELFSAVYLNENLLLEYLRHIRVILASVKKAAYRQLVLSFFLKSLRIWISARPKEFLNCTRQDSLVSQEADVVFDELSQMPDMTASGNRTQGIVRPLKTSFKFMAILLTLKPSTLEASAGREKHNVSAFKKLTSFNTNRKQKVLNQVFKCLDQQQSKDSSENTTVLESLDFMVTIARVAASIYTIEPSHSIVSFTETHYDMVCRVLVPIESNKACPLLHNASAMEHQLYQKLRMNYFSGICVLRSNDALPVLIDMLNDESVPLETLSIACSILNSLISSPTFKSNANHNLLMDMYPALRRVMIRVGALVKSNSYNPSLLDEEDNTSFGKSSSSASSVEHHSTHKGTVIDNLRTSTPSSNASGTPKAEKLKDGAKSLLKHHHSSSHVTVHTANSSFTFDETRSNSKEFQESSAKVSQLSREVMTNAFALFRKNPHAYFYTYDDGTAVDRADLLVQNGPDLVEPLSIALKDTNIRLAQSARYFLQGFISVSNIADTAETVVGAYIGTGLIIYALAKSMAFASASEIRRKDDMEYFVKVLEYRIGLYDSLEHHSYFAEARASEPRHLEMRSFVEESLLVCLATPTSETYSFIKRAFRALVVDFERQGSDLLYNDELYKAVANDTTLITGQVALQKNVRKIFLKVKYPTLSMINFWQRIYERWFQFAKSDYSELTQTEMSNFRNYAGCLAAISGVFADIEVPNNNWYTQDTRDDINVKIDVFVNQQFVMLGEDDLVTRENAKEILASEANPKTYPKIIRSLVSIVDDLYTRQDDLGQRDFAIIDHVISLLKSVLDQGDEITVFGISIPIIRCVDKLASILDNKSSTDMTMLKLRIRMSMLFCRVEKNNVKLVTRNAFKIRNKFLRYVYNWFEVAINSSCDCKDSDHQKSHHNEHSKEWEFIHIDVAIESIKALALLLDGLVLEAPQVLNERELRFSKSSLFSIYFNTFLRALERFSDVEQFPVSVRYKVSTVSENIVLSLTNLLKSNVDVGLEYALPIGYYTNLAIRVSFLKVFVSIVESYSKIDHAHLRSDKTDFVIKIFELILQNPKLLTAIGKSCPSNEAPALASCALSMASSMNQSAPMVAYLVNEEILSAMKYSDILRRNSFASRCLSSFGRSVGRNYLVSTLKPILTEIRDSEADLEVEKLDPNDPVAEQNLINFMHYLKKLVNVIISSKDQVPIEFKYVCKSISEAVDDKFTNSRLIAVGSFIFLRFFCPAIVSPESERIVDVPNRSIQRKFLLLARVLQNMANGTDSSLRWPLLRSRVEELNGLNQKITQFLDDLTVVEDGVNFKAREMSAVTESDFNFFHAYVYDHWDLVRDEFLKNSNEKEDILFFKKLSVQVDEFFMMAGQPTMTFGYEIPPSITPEANPDLYEFMTKYSAKDLGILSECPFVHNAFNQDGVHLMVFSYSEYEKVKDIDEELLLYRFIQVCSKVWDQKFLFVVDCTGNDGSLLFPRHMMSMLGNFAPDQMRENCQGIVYYNVSSGLCPSLLNTLKSGSTFQSIGSDRFSFLSAMEDRKTVMNLGLSNQAVRIYNDVRVKFSDVSIFEPEHGRFEPVMLKIGNEFMQLSRTTPHRVKFRGELKEICLNDVYRLDEIEQVTATETTTVPNEMTIAFKDGKKIVLASAKFLEIMRLLYFTKTRSLNVSGPDLSKGELEDSVEDMLGQLFNVIFLGLTSSAHEVRSISYNLLAACQKHFKFDIGKDLVQLHDVYFPRDNNSFVVSISEKLAVSMPHITGEFVKSFFGVYNNTITPRQRFSAILYVSPWISNLYEYVFRSDDEHGRDMVAEIIRNFLAVSTKDITFLSAFSLSIFSKICLEDRINDILVDEVVLNAVDREAEGNDWMTSTSFLTSTPTVEICGYVIKRLREITHIPFPNSEGKYSLESHGTWTEITVLTHIAVSLFFDSLILAEMFLPDVFHIVTILVDVGPLNLRKGCHQLLLNIIQSFLSKKELSEDSKNIIRATVEHFTSHRSRLLFGLTRDSSDSFQTEITKFSNRISTMESLVASLMEVIEIAALDQKPVWVARWNRYALDAVCKTDSVLRGRALVLFGILSKGGVSDVLVRIVLGYIAEISSESPSDPRFMYLAICTIFALGKISEGLLLESEMFTKMFWLAVVITHSKHSAVFQGGLKFVTNCIDSMSIKEQFVDCDVVGTLMAGKARFGDMLDKIEGLSQIKITSKNFDQVMLSFTVRGLQLPYAKASAISSLRSFFQVRLMNDMMKASYKGEQLDQNSLCFLFFLFILMKPSDLHSVLDDIDYSDDYLYVDEQVHIPKILMNYMASDSDSAYLTLYQAALYFSNGSANDKTNLRFLHFMRILGHRNQTMFIRIYPLIRDTLRAIINSSSAPVDVHAEILNVAAIAAVMPEYQEFNKSLAIIDDLLARYDLTGLKRALSNESPAAEPPRGFMIRPVIELMMRD